MVRTKLMDREMPTYTRGEERFNMISHIVGCAVGVTALVLGIVVSAIHHNGYGIASSIVYGLSMILLYTMSSIYHGLHDGKAKRVLQVLDHCTIYLLIAGTYTPILLSAIRPIDPVACWTLFIVIWVLAAVAITLTAIDLQRYRVFSMICYICMGWSIVVRVPLLIEAVGMNGFWLILSGGLSYTIGAIIYNVGKKRRYMHCVFHFFVVLGSVLQLIAILLYVL